MTVINKKRQRILDYCECMGVECGTKMCLLSKFCDNYPGEWIEELPGEDLDEALELIDDFDNDPVNHPSHYTDGEIEVIDFIEDKKLGFHLGNAVKYIARSGKKDPEKEIEDIKKAIWYLNRYVAELEEV